MSEFQYIKEMSPQSGSWSKCSDKLAILKKEPSLVYRSEQEPSWNAWCVTWKYPNGELGLTFSECTGELTSWPPNYSFTDIPVTMRRKFFISKDGGRTWQDTGEGYNPVELNRGLNSDVGHQNIVALPDGRLLRTARGNYMDKDKMDTRPVYDTEKAQTPCSFPFTYREAMTKYFYPRFMASNDGGNTWEEIAHIDTEIPIYFTGFHRLSNGLLVATGALEEGKLPEGFKAVICDSADDGKTWSKPQVFGINDEINRGLCEESDFAELEDGTLLLINRCIMAEGSDVLFHLKREEDGHWTTLSHRRPEHFIKTGYPSLMRASDGTLFHDRNTSLLYSCDNGESWEPLPLALTYYGRLIEAAPGRILNIAQNNIGDSPFPYWYDAEIRQTAFEYRRYARFAQTDNQGGTLSLSDSSLDTFHLCLQAELEKQFRLVWGKDEDNGLFAQLEVRDGQLLFFQLGVIVNGEEDIQRIYCVSAKRPQAPVELQVDCAKGQFKAAVKIAEGDWFTGGNPPCYLTMPANPQTRGQLFAHLTATGTVSDIRFAPQGNISIRDNWLNPSFGGKLIELDAGRVF